MNLKGRSSNGNRPRRGQIAVGLMGVGPMWERRYRTAVECLQERLAVRVVYDAVFAKAQLAASELKAEAVPGLRQLFERSDLQAILVFDPAWYDLFPIELACEYRKPVFLAGSLGQDRAALEKLHLTAQAQETLVMAEFSRRYTPATNRLRELIATRLGEAHAVSVDALLPVGPVAGPLPGQACERDYLAGLLDWCQYITGRVPTSLSTGSTAGSTTGDSTTVAQGGPLETNPWQVVLGFRPDAAGHPATSATLNLQPTDGPPSLGNDSAEDWPFPRHQVVCTHGSAVISAAREIGWQNGTQASLGVEQLAAERSDAEVMLDQFCRRLNGGLVPVADLEDVCRALRLVEVAEASRQSGSPQSLSWKS